MRGSRCSRWLLVRLSVRRIVFDSRAVHMELKGGEKTLGRLLYGYCSFLVSFILPPQQYCHIPSSALVAVESELR